MQAQRVALGQVLVGLVELGWETGYHSDPLKGSMVEDYSTPHITLSPQVFEAKFTLPDTAFFRKRRNFSGMKLCKAGWRFVHNKQRGRG